MNLESLSPVEAAMKRVVGEPSSLIDYEKSMAPTPTQDVTLGAEQPSVATPTTAAEDPWLAQMRAQTANIMAQTAAIGQPAANASTWGSDLLGLQKQYGQMPSVLTTMDQARKSSEIQNAIANLAVNRPEGATEPSGQEQMAALYPSLYRK
jgi:hypothetical protein